MFGQRRAKAWGARQAISRLVGIFLAVMLCSQLTAFDACPASPTQPGVEASTVPSTADCNSHVLGGGRSDSGKSHGATCCLLCDARGFDPAIQPAESLGDAIVVPSDRALPAWKRHPEILAPFPIGWKTSWSAQAPPAIA